jgi:dUTP pyrophosphatase
VTQRAPLIEVRILDERLRTWGLPDYQSADAAAVDIHACIDAPLAVAPQQPAVLVPSGFAVHIGDPCIAALVLPRSGLGHKAGLVLGNGTGLIDADYLGQIFVSVWNRSAPGGEPVRIEPGDRIAQLVFVPIVRPGFTIVEAFSRTTARGAGGFGSTGNGLPPPKESPS